MSKEALNAAVWREYEKGLDFNARIKLDETVRTNENFFIGKQWEGVEAGGLPTPVFNFLKRAVMFTVTSITSSSTKMIAAPLSGTASRPEDERITDILNAEFDSLFETNCIGDLICDFLRNAAVDGDGCLYTYWDPDRRTGAGTPGGIVTEIVENTRIFFGDTGERRVQKQPYIIIMSRELLDEVRARAGGAELAADGAADGILADDNKVTVLLKMWRGRDTGTIMACECTRGAVLRGPWDTGLTRYPITFLNWDYVQDCYHGQAMITGLIPNQIFINKLFAMSMISLMTTAYPKIVYDKTRVARWDNRVGAAIGVSGGDVNSVARIIDPAQISPQIAQFIDIALSYTQTFLGATPAALGDVRPDNTSAIIALQKASAVPNEKTRRAMYQCIEELGRIYIDFMSCFYGARRVYAPLSGQAARAAKFAGAESAGSEFDFSQLREKSVSLRLDVGASSYWSEIASMQTLDNLMRLGKIGLREYLERIPDGYIIKREELIRQLTGNGEPETGGDAGALTDAAQNILQLSAGTPGGVR